MKLLRGSCKMINLDIVTTASGYWETNEVIKLLKSGRSRCILVRLRLSECDINNTSRYLESVIDNCSSQLDLNDLNNISSSDTINFIKFIESNKNQIDPTRILTWLINLFKNRNKESYQCIYFQIFFKYYVPTAEIMINQILNKKLVSDYNLVNSGAIDTIIVPGFSHKLSLKNSKKYKTLTVKNKWFKLQLIKAVLKCLNQLNNQKYLMYLDASGNYIKSYESQLSNIERLKLIIAGILKLTKND